jgi:hypothetical protein
VDVAPSLLYLLGASVPDDMDGCVRADLFKADFVRGNQPRYDQAAGSGAHTDGVDLADQPEDEELRRRLQSLGYLE